MLGFDYQNIVWWDYPNIPNGDSDFDDAMIGGWLIGWIELE